ncbi:MAG TPA: diguanylate cyclase, partial [Thalassospira sp.]|nr:diguanylate cyclase [Thalassospira sp.]
MARERDEAKEHQKDLTRVRKKDANYLAELVELGIALSASQGREELNQKILMAARNFTNADGG